MYDSCILRHYLAIDLDVHFFLLLVAKNRKPVRIPHLACNTQSAAAAGDNDHHEKHRIWNTSGDSDCKKLDENGSNKGKKNGNGEANLDICNENVAGAEANEDTLQLQGNDKTDGGSSIHNPQAARGTNSIVSDNLLEQHPKTELHVFERLRSVDTFDDADFDSPSSGLSTSDGVDDQKLYSFKNSCSKTSNYLVPEETIRRRDKLPGKGKMNGNSGMQDPATNLSLDFSNKKHYAAQKYSMGHRDEQLEPVMHRHCPPRSSSRLDTDERPLHIPLSQKAYLHGYESAGPSRESQDKFPFDSTFYPHKKIEPSTDVPWRQDHFATYCCQESPEGENFYLGHNGRHGPKSSWSRESRFVHMPSSGSAINTRYSIDGSCLCCHPQDWQHSSEHSHPPIFMQKRELCRAGHIGYYAYSSFPSSPLRYLESGFSNQRYRDHELKRYLGETSFSRRHLRPTAGGAPFIAVLLLHTVAVTCRFFTFQKEVASAKMRCLCKDPVSHGSIDTKNVLQLLQTEKGICSKQSQRENRTSKEAFDSTEPLSSEVEELPPRSGGTSLHRLMGYSSPSHLIDGIVSSISGSTSVHSGEALDDNSNTV
ncbi:hypothetical protein F3Y22_tig00110194pilonHSYRG00098 [Hibiscus syriacus]|uniref:Uncharacterized protein n=1 Tax=Hibiscus syriacus TaxID=106335 RepID=A0A6A3BCX5_HIBSY|nr:hypothetical protein F3Y22_tig00110194pilonHSYRG00098 [Hibiscus syriacus]